MKDKQYAKTISTPDGLTIYYWMNWNKSLTKEFKVIHPAASMNHSSLEPIEKGLTERGHPTILLDARGFGYSQGPAEKKYYSLDRYTADLQQIIEQEGIEKPSFVGHSLGFMPIIDYVAKTGNCKNITGICASHNFAKTAPNEAMFNIWNFFKFYEYGGSALIGLAHKLRGETRGYSNQSNLEGKSDFDVFCSLLDIPIKEIKVHMVNGSDIPMDISDQLKKIDVPMLLVYGNKDLFVRPFAGEYISELCRNHKNSPIVEVTEGSHSLPLISPKKVLGIMDKHLS